MSCSLIKDPISIKIIIDEPRSAYQDWSDTVISLLTKLEVSLNNGTLFLVKYFSYFTT